MGATSSASPTERATPLDFEREAACNSTAEGAAPLRVREVAVALENALGAARCAGEDGRCGALNFRALNFRAHLLIAAIRESVAPRLREGSSLRKHGGRGSARSEGRVEGNRNPGGAMA